MRPKRGSPRSLGGRMRGGRAASSGWVAHAGLQDRTHQSARAYLDEVSESRVGAQIGWAGWGADYPSAAGFIDRILSCAAFVPASPGQNSNFEGFCDRSIDAQMSRASARRCRIRRPRRPSGKRSRTPCSRRRRSCLPTTEAMSPSSPSASATTSTTRSRCPARPALGEVAPAAADAASGGALFRARTAR